MDTVRPKIYLNMILADYEPVDIVKRSIDSVKNYVDGLYVAVTYKDKEPRASHPLVKLLQKYGANYYFFQWVDDFAVARQFIMDKTPKGPLNYIYWQDADDVLKGGENLRMVTDDLVRSGYSAAFFTYFYIVDLDENGEIKNSILEHKRERVIKNDDTYKWIGGLHETLISQKQENVSQFVRKECSIVHMTSEERFDRNLERNIRILEKQLQKEKGRDPRTLIYLAKAYFDKGKSTKDPDQKISFDLALKLFHDYLHGQGSPGTATYVEASGWPEERATAWKYVGEIAFLRGDYQMAEKAFITAINEYPFYPDYYVDLAMCYTAMNNFPLAKHWLKIATTIEMPNTSHIVTPRDLQARALEVAFQVSFNEGNFKEAIRNIESLLELFPNDSFHKERRDQVVDVEKTNRAGQSLIFLGKFLENSRDPMKKELLAHLVQSIPAELRQEKFASEMRHLFVPPRKWEDNEITILCGPGAGQWSPQSVERGVGGSEEAVIYLAKELTKKGWKVTVYGNPQNELGEYEGVNYLPWYDCNQRDEFNVLILWRFIGFVDFNPKAKFTMLWLHDVPNNPDYTQERVDKVDKIAVLSEYHKSLLRVFKDGIPQKMPSEKIFLTSNGIPDLSEELVDKIERNPRKAIYSSSPDRGLVYLLHNWEKVKTAVPDAELHIYYGFDVFDALYGSNPGKQEWKNMVLQMMKQPGIIYHGKIGHKALHREFLSAGVWAYPTDFTEISCITGMKAQALGAIPVCTTMAALDETVKNGVKVDVDITEKAGQEEYFTALIDVLKNETRQEELRPEMMKWAKDYFAWENVAGLWDELFRVNLQNPELKVREV